MTNYEILKQSEKQLHADFSKYCNHVISIWESFLKLTTKDKIDDIEMSLISKMEDESDMLEASIQDECIWTISKNQPFANHLRYVIAILNSAKDLERMSDYAYSASKFLVNRDVNKEVKILINNMTNKAIQTMKKIFETLRKKPAFEAFKICQKYHITFKTDYDSMLDSLVDIIKEQTAKDIALMFHGGIIVLKHIERSVDHAINIVENFVFIKSSDFFFDKKKYEI